MKNKKIIKRIPLMFVIMIIIIGILIINLFERRTYNVSNINSTVKSKASAQIYGETIEGVNKSGTIETFTKNVPSGTILFDNSKASTINAGENGYTLETNGNNNIVKRNLITNSSSTDTPTNRVVYLGPNGDGLPAKTEGYITNAEIDKNASEENRSKFTMKFKDVVTMQDSSTRDITITISNIYVINQRSDKVQYSAMWTGTGISVLGPSDDVNDNREYENGCGVAMHCDISISVLNDDGTPLEGENILFEVTDLDVRDHTRIGSTNNYAPKANDENYNQDMTDEEKLQLYNSDYRESLYILNGALTDAYMPETNWLEVKRLSQGSLANGLRFSAYEQGDDATVNTGFLAVIDSKETKLRWYGSASTIGMGTVLFTRSSNHHIKSTSSLGGYIRTDFAFNYLNNENIITNTVDLPQKYGSFQHNFMDGVNVPYVMQADSGHYMEKITIDNNEFLPADFTNVNAGESDKTIKITKGEKEYTFVVTKDTDGNVIKAEYIFEKNNANHEIAVKWNEITDSTYKVEYYYDGKIDNTKTETKEAPIGSKIDKYTDKVKDGYILQKVEGIPLTINEDSTKNIIKVYYVKRNDLSYKVNYLEKGTNNVIHEPKTVDNKTYGDVINSADEVIEIDTYKYNNADKETLTISTDNNEINLYYVKRNDLSYKVNYLEKGTNNVIHTPKTVENQTIGKVINSADEVIQIDTYKYSNADKEKLTISTNNNEINLYYEKEKEITATVKYMEKGTNTEIKPETPIPGLKPNDTILAKDYNKEITGYVYDSANPDTLKITEDNDKNVMILYYTKKNDTSNYTVNYLDKDTNKVIHEQKVVEKAKLNTIINAKDEVIDITNYKYDSSDKENITVVEDNDKNIINLYYTKKNGNVVIKYVDEDTGKEIASSDTITGKIDDDYTSKSKTIDGYDLSKNSGNTNGKITEKDTTVVYYYKAKKVTPAKQEVTTLPKTGNTNSFLVIISIVVALSVFFAIRYHKLKNIK